MSKEECCTCSDRLNYVKLCEKYDQLESIHEVLVEDNLTYENQIADLEAKLAEKEEKLDAQTTLRKMMSDESNVNLLRYIEILAKNEELKQQLAEWQDGTIICKWTDAENKIKELEQRLAEKEELIIFADRTIKGLVLAKEIDKISFALDHINKLKNDLYDNEKINIRACDFDEIDNIFDNQIKQLKEMK